MMSLILVAIGGALGSVARFLATSAVGKLTRLEFPYGTLTVNIAGSLAMGLLVGWLARVLPSSSNELRLLLAVGFLGGFTTFSSFSLDAVTLFEEGQVVHMLAYMVASVVLSLLALIAGLYVMRLAA